MRDNPFHTFFLFLTGQIGDQTGLGALGWFTVFLYWALLIGMAVTVITNWQRDPAQRTARHVVIFLTRWLASGMWFLGTLWKLPWPVSSGFKFWMEQTVKYSSFQSHSDIMQMLYEYIGVVQPLVYLLELFIAASLMLGLMIRLSGIIGALFIANLLIGLYNDPTEWPWTYVGVITTMVMFAATRAGLSLGLDNLIAKRLVRFPGDTGGLGALVRLAG